MSARTLLLLSIILLVTSCDSLFLGEDENQISFLENMQSPPSLSDGLDVSTLAEENIDSELIQNVVKFIGNNNDANIHSLLIVRNNKLVLESYFNGWNRNRKHDLRSATKSITSSLVGIAIDKQFLTSVDQPVFSLFPEYKSFKNWDERKATIPIRHFLQMRTGLECNDWSGGSLGNEEKMYERNDWIKFILDLPIATTSGIQFSYCTGAPVVLGGVISNASKIEIPEFSKKYLFDGLGIKDYRWEFQPNGNTDTGGHIHLAPRDMAKFGLLFLNRGNFHGEQIISEAWVDESVKSTDDIAPSNFSGTGYGYFWWTKNWSVNGNSVASFYANGNGGQYIMIFPSLNAVIVFTGGKYNGDYESIPFGVLKGKILPAFK